MKKEKLSIDSWYDPKRKITISVINDSCYFCPKNLVYECIAIYYWNVHGKNKAYACGDCIDKIKSIEAEFMEYEIVHLVSHIPKKNNLIPRIHRKPRLVPGRLDNAPTSSKDGAVIIDRTKYAGRDSLEGAQIGLSESKLEALDFNRSSCVPESILYATPLIESSNKKLIDDGGTK